MKSEVACDMTSEILIRDATVVPTKAGIMHPKTGITYSSIGITYAETVKIDNEGPFREVLYLSSLKYAREVRFKQGVCFISKMVPSLYCTTLVVNEKSDFLQYMEMIHFNLCISPEIYFEEVCIFPKECKRNFISEITYNNYGLQQRQFTTKINVFIQGNCVIDVPLEREDLDNSSQDMFEDDSKRSHLNNQLCDLVVNGSGSANYSDVVGQYITTKDIMIEDTELNSLLDM